MDVPPSPPREPRPRVHFGAHTFAALATAFALLFASGALFGARGYIAFLLAAALVAIVAVPALRRPAVFVLYALLLFYVVTVIF
ncbi:MAG TPA: hypothetical protein VGX78_19350 [Pirellulales bacterium]|jgi:hypothetical protein|nr:hypothetical protein [Pirellulales bacterium]